MLLYYCRPRPIAKSMNTVNYTERKNFVKFDEKHYLLYLNEQPADVEVGGDQEERQTVKGFSYTGPEIDGSTKIQASDVTDANRRSKFIAGLLGTEYSIDDQIALLANDDDTNEHAEELAVFLADRKEIKKVIDELLAREI